MYVSHKPRDVLRRLVAPDEYSLVCYCVVGGLAVPTIQPKKPAQPKGHEAESNPKNLADAVSPCSAITITDREVPGT